MSTTMQSSAKGAPGAPLNIDLRDWFAGQALPIAKAVFEALDPEEIPDNVPDYIAFVSYDIANAMLAERARLYDAEAKS